MDMHIVLAVSFLIFLVSMIQDSRRFRNGIFLLLFLLLLILDLLVYYGPTPYGSLVLAIVAILTVFLVLIVPVLLIINGIFMIMREGHSLANLLSLLFGIFILAGEFVLIRGLYHIFNTEGTVSFWYKAVQCMLGSAVFYVSMVFLAFMFYTWLIGVIPHRANYNYIIVLGAGLLDGERVSKLLSDRLDKAIKVYERSLSDCKFIVSGGQGPDEKISEAEAMKQYLLSKGIDEKDIIKEDRSTDTMENLVNSKAIIDSRRGDHYTAVVSSGYHILRAMIYSRKIGLQADGIGAHTALYYWPSAMIREYAALVKYYFFPYMLGLLVCEFIIFMFMLVADL